MIQAVRGVWDGARWADAARGGRAERATHGVGGACATTTHGPPYSTDPSDAATPASARRLHSTPASRTATRRPSAEADRRRARRRAASGYATAGRPFRHKPAGGASARRRERRVLTTCVRPRLGVDAALTPRRTDAPPRRERWPNTDPIAANLRARARHPADSERVHRRNVAAVSGRAVGPRKISGRTLEGRAASSAPSCMPPASVVVRRAHGGRPAALSLPSPPLTLRAPPSHRARAAPAPAAN